MLHSILRLYSAKNTQEFFEQGKEEKRTKICLYEILRLFTHDLRSRSCGTARALSNIV